MPSVQASPSWREPAARERARVQAHLSRAEALMERADTRALDPLRQWIRALLLDELRRYRRRGRFPQNRDFPRQTPYFVDAEGTRCAVAHLLELSGEGALVRRVARERNHARVHELAGEPRLAAWLLATGISLEEAAAIQPAYCEEESGDPAACICTAQYGASHSTPPLEAVLEGRLIAPVDFATARVQLDAVHGSTTRYAPGDEVLTAVGGVPPGTQVLIPLGSEVSAGANEAGAYPVGLALPNRVYQCHTIAGPSPALDAQQLVNALLAPRCRDYLESLSSAWSPPPPCDPGCGACATTGETPPTSAGILFALLALLVRRRRRASAPPR